MKSNNSLKWLLHAVSVFNSVHSTLGGCNKALSLLGYTCKLLASLINRYTLSSTTTRSLVKGLRDLFSQTSWARYSIRLINGPGSVLDAIINDSWSSKTLPFNGLKDEEIEHYPYTKESHPYVKVIEKTMPYAMAVYYPSEYIAFAQWNMPGILYNDEMDSKSGGSAITSFRNKFNWYSPGHYSALSCAAWLCYVVCDIIVQAERCYRITSILQRIESRVSEGEAPLSSLNTDHIKELESQLKSSQWLLIQEALCVVPAFAWSWPDCDDNPKVPTDVVNLFMWLENIIGYVTDLNQKNLLNLRGK